MKNLLFIICLIFTSMCYKNNSKSNKSQADSGYAETLPDSVLDNAWKEILNINGIGPLKKHNYSSRVDMYESVEKYHGFDNLSDDSELLKLKKKLNDSFYIITFIPNDRYQLGGSFRVFIDLKTYKILFIIGGV